MHILATFVGVDRHLAQDIRDLIGARRDAMALNCVFTDSLPDAEIRTLCDEDATVETVRSAMNSTLGAASDQDTVIFSFSGHGTSDHRIVLNDTRRDALNDTTISMSDIANAFKTCKASTIICIIDCCFSGGAPAKVLEGTPIPRDLVNPFTGIIGNGRVLIAACDATEVAYEHPFERQGLLTKAIISVLCESDAPFGIGMFLDRVLENVRAEAGKIGVVQTPHIVNNVSGGMTLPLFHKGDKYRQEFPESSGIKVGAAISELSAFNIPEEVIRHWTELYPNGLNDLQQNAVNDGGILRDQSLLVVAPTSSGKTYIGEMATARVIAQHRKAVFLFPYKALVNEKYDQFESLYGQKLHYRVIRCTGDYNDQAANLFQGKYELAILTYEMFLSISLDKPEILHSIGLVVIDEAHFITDPSRGITVELILTYLLSARDRGIRPQLIALSAVIGNINNFDAWLDCNKIISDKRPIPLIEGVIDRNGIFQYIDVDGVTKEEQLVPHHEIRRRNTTASAQDLIVPLAKKLMIDGEKIIVFRNQRGKAQGCAAYLAKDVGLPSATTAISLLTDRDVTSATRKLRECLIGGTAFHTSNLTREEREIVERTFRNPSGQIQILAATTTVAAGINTPADTVIVAEQEFKGEDGRQFTVSEYKNMAGRAGRLGIRDRGRSIIYAETSLQRQQLFQRYVKGLPEDLSSSFSPEHLDTWLIRLLAQIRSIPRGEVVNLLLKSYGGYLENRRNVKWQQEITKDVEQYIQQMISLDLLEEEMSKVSLTLLGRACGLSSLGFKSAMRLVSLVKEIGVSSLTPSGLVAIVQCLDEMDNHYTPVANKGAGKETQWTGLLSQRLGYEYMRVMQRFAQDGRGYAARCKRVCIINDWISGASSESIESTYTITLFVPVGYGDIVGIANATRFHLRSARQIVALLLSNTSEFEEEMETLLTRLEIGVPSECLPLLPLSLTREEYLELLKAGITSLDQLRNQGITQLAAVFGEALSTRLKDRLQYIKT